MIHGNNNGKILKIKKGYNPNCSSGMWFFSYYLLICFGGIAVFISSIIISQLIYKRTISKNKKQEVVPD
ncbi:MAG: hypothetical protein ACW96U_08670 [Candidatus Heimdallarchaeaceae archaeon]|jgi:hypothetical protein